MDDDQRATVAIIAAVVSIGVGFASDQTGIGFVGGLILAVLIYTAKPKERG